MKKKRYTKANLITAIGSLLSFGVGIGVPLIIDNVFELNIALFTAFSFMGLIIAGILFTITLIINDRMQNEIILYNRKLGDFLDNNTIGTWNYNLSTGLIDVVGSFSFNLNLIMEVSEYMRDKGRIPFSFGDVMNFTSPRNIKLKTMQGFPKRVRMCSIQSIIENFDWEPERVDELSIDFDVFYASPYASHHDKVGEMIKKVDELLEKGIVKKITKSYHKHKQRYYELKLIGVL